MYFPGPPTRITTDSKKNYRYEDHYADNFEHGYWQLALKYEQTQRANFSELQEDLVTAIARILKIHGIADTTYGVECLRSSFEHTTAEQKCLCGACGTKVSLRRDEKR